MPNNDDDDDVQYYTRKSKPKIWTFEVFRLSEKKPTNLGFFEAIFQR